MERKQLNVFGGAQTYAGSAGVEEPLNPIGRDREPLAEQPLPQYMPLLKKLSVSAVLLGTGDCAGSPQQQVFSGAELDARFLRQGHREPRRVMDQKVIGSLEKEGPWPLPSALLPPSISRGLFLFIRNICRQNLSNHHPITPAIVFTSV